MRILVTGSRDWIEWETVWNALYEESQKAPANGTVTVVHGDCPTGADRMARGWCADMAHHFETFWRGVSIVEERHPADWKRYGKSAGPRRNREMVNLGADLCLAFIRNNSPGASKTAEWAERAGIPTRIHREDG